MYLRTHDIHPGPSRLGSTWVAGRNQVFSTVLPLDVLDVDDALVAILQDLHTLLVWFAVIHHPGDGGFRFPCDGGWEVKCLSCSDDHTVLHRQVQLDDWLLCG